MERSNIESGEVCRSKKLRGKHGDISGPELFGRRPRHGEIARLPKVKKKDEK